MVEISEDLGAEIKYNCLFISQPEDHDVVCVYTTEEAIALIVELQKFIEYKTGIEQNASL